MQLSPKFERWLTSRNWTLHPHQRELLSYAARPAQLLIAPTGAGKTLSGFLPTLLELEDGAHTGLHTLYVSPLKALAADIKRNLQTPIDEMDLPIRVEDRTGDTSNTQKNANAPNHPISF